MPAAKMNLKNVKDRLKDETLDLSLCDLEEVPVREIATLRKAIHLDLSNNLLVSLPSAFVTLKQIVKLDLSKNSLTEIPQNFGELKQLKHLDLYANQISRLPLSLSELKNLRWLDLKENPLTPAVASVAGPCSNLSECQACARNIVAYLTNVKLTVEEVKLRRMNAAADMDAATLKKEKKKNKKAAEKVGKEGLDKNGSKTSSKVSSANENQSKVSSAASSQICTNKKSTFKAKSAGGFCRTFIPLILWTLFLFFAFALSLAILPRYYAEQSQFVMEYVENRTGVPVRALQKQTADALLLGV